VPGRKPYDPLVPKQEPSPEHGESLPAWSLAAGAGDQISIGVDWPERVTREWAWGGSTGKGVRVCILDSGVEPGHPLVGKVDSAVVVSAGAPSALCLFSAPNTSTAVSIPKKKTNATTMNANSPRPG